MTPLAMFLSVDNSLTLLLAIVAMLAAVLCGNRISVLGLMAALILGSVALFAAYLAGGGA